MTNPASRHCRPVTGGLGAVSAAHPLAVSAAVRALAAGGCAVDAAIAAQAMICVTMPQAAGLGGDLLALVRAGGTITAINGTGRSAVAVPATTDGGAAVTVPGLVRGWVDAHERWGRLPLDALFESAIDVAERGYRVDQSLARAVRAQRERIVGFGASAWPLLSAAEGSLWRQPELARLLRGIATSGADALYAGDAGAALVAAIVRHGGGLTRAELAAQQTELLDPVAVAWERGILYVQPPAAQGVLLAMAAQWIDGADAAPAILDHLLVEATEAAFEHRDAVTSATVEDLLSAPLRVDPERAGRRGGPRAYLHTAGVAVADATGMVVSSLISVFDDFGSGVYVPELGIVLNDRAAGFTVGGNSWAPGARPVHTLAPAMLVGADGAVLGLATPGADGQVQTLLQVLARMRFDRLSLADALTWPRWRSEGGRLLIEHGHPALGALEAAGHPLVARERGDDVFGAVVAAGFARDTPFAAADWRRDVSTGAV